MLGFLWRYGLAGIISALVHAYVLVSLAGFKIPVYWANLAGFLLASCWSYYIHSQYSFRKLTGGRFFPRQWLLLQLGLNVSLSLVLPWAFGAWASTIVAMVLLVLTPTFVNFLVWYFAARHTSQLNLQASILGISSLRLLPVQVHADDLGLAEPINEAIFDLADRNQLHGASLMISAPAVESALLGWRQRPKLHLALHLVLTEGPPTAPICLIPDLVNERGDLSLDFATLFLYSFYSNVRSLRIAAQLFIEVEAQIKRFQLLTGISDVSIDGHQHVHLLPIVWRQLLQLPPSQRPVWMRTAQEPWPSGLGLKSWVSALLHGGVFKGLVLYWLSHRLLPQLLATRIATNASFAGVFFTGRMAGKPLLACYRYLANSVVPLGRSSALLLVHPAQSNIGSLDQGVPINTSYRYSQDFYSSFWRQKEYNAVADLPLPQFPIDLVQASHPPNVLGR